jgi:uncharacterized membrane protein YhaH (DUF805 family)
MSDTIQARALLVLKLFLTPFGRIRPSLYWTGMAVLAAAGLVVNLGYGMFSQPPSPFFPFARLIAVWSGAALQTPGPGAGLMLEGGRLRFWGGPVAAEITFVFILARFCLQAKRLHDAGRSAWWPVAFALFQFLAPVALGYLTKTLFRPEDLRSLFFYGGGYVAVCMLLPVLFKLWIGLMKSRPEPNLHGPQPGRWQVAMPDQPVWRRRAKA